MTPFAVAVVVVAIGIAIYAAVAFTGGGRSGPSKLRVAGTVTVRARFLPACSDSGYRADQELVTLTSQAIVVVQAGTVVASTTLVPDSCVPSSNGRTNTYTITPTSFEGDPDALYVITLYTATVSKPGRELGSISITFN